MDEATLRIHLFGSMELASHSLETAHESLGSAPLDLSSSKARSLLAYLIVHHDRPFHRDRLAGQFWPERSNAQARHALSQALWQIRSALEPVADRVVAERDVVMFQLLEDDTVDVEEFEMRVDGHIAAEVGSTLSERIRVLSEAVALYRADFLTGCYDEWALVERERLRERYLGALDRLVTLHEQQGTYAQALTYAQRLVAADPLRETGHQEVMRLYYLLGRPRAALEQFTVLEELLRDELDISPTPATVALYREIAESLEELSAPHLPLPTSPPPLLHDLAHLPFVGRREERARMLDALQAAVQGQGGVALVEGDAGVGKTRLVNEVAADAAWRGWQVGQGKADAQRVSAPYQALRHMLSPLLTPLRVVQLSELVEPIKLSAAALLFPAIAEQLADLPPLPSLDPEEEQRFLWQGLSQCVIGLASVAPLLLVLEDLHWADEATLATIRHLASRFLSGRVLLVFTYRPAEARQRPAVWETLEELDRTRPLERIYLAPFDPAAAVTFIHRALGVTEADASAMAFARRLYDEMGSNPLFLVETLRSLLERGVLAPSSAGKWVFPSPSLSLSTPASIQELVTERLTHLAPDLGAVLASAAVLGSEADFVALSRVSDADPPALLSALAELGRRGFLVETEAHYRFEHDQIQEIAYQTIAPDRRAALHRRAGRVIEALHPEEVEALAHHFTQGAVWDRAVTYHLKAGQQARALQAPQAAWRHTTRVLEILDAHRPFCDREAADLAFRARAARRELAWMRGDVEQAESNIEALLRLADRLCDPERQAEAFNQQSWFLCNAKDEYSEACRVAQAALCLAQDHDLPRQAAVALRNLGLALQRSGNYREAESALQQSLATWEALDEASVQVAEVRIYLAQVYEQTGDIDDAEALGLGAVTAAQAADAPLTVARAYALLARLAYRQARHHACIQYHQASLEEIRQIGHKQNEAVELSNLGFIHWSLRDYGRAISFMKQGLEIYRQIGNRRGVIGAMDNLSGLYHEVGRRAEAEEAIREGLAQARQIDFPYTEALLLATHARLCLDQGRIDAAGRAIRQAQQVAGTIAAPYVDGVVNLSLGMLRWAQEDQIEADQHFAQSVEDFEAAGESDFVTAARSFWALSQQARGNLERAVDLSTQAVTDLEAAHGGEYVQDTYYHHWRILQAAGREDEAQVALEKAFRNVQAQAETLPDPAWRRDFLTQVPMNRAILAAWEMIQPQRITRRLPAASAPTGRPLSDEEYVEVSWTVTAPEDDEITGRVDRRRYRVLRLLREAAAQSAAPTLQDLAAALDVSVSTIKRDLAALRRADHEVSTRGSRGR